MLMIKMSKAPKCSTLYNYDHFECISIGDRIKTHKIDGKECVHRQRSERAHIPFHQKKKKKTSVLRKQSFDVVCRHKSPLFQCVDYKWRSSKMSSSHSLATPMRLTLMVMVWYCLFYLFEAFWRGHMMFVATFWAIDWS